MFLGAGIARETAMSVLLMPRSLVCFADAAYADHLHGIDEVRHWQAASFTACVVCGLSSFERPPSPTNNFAPVPLSLLG